MQRNVTNNQITKRQKSVTKKVQRRVSEERVRVGVRVGEIWTVGGEERRKSDARMNCRNR